jgi:hypothetical protein
MRMDVCVSVLGNHCLGNDRPTPPPYPCCPPHSGRYVVHQAFEGFALGGIISSAVHKAWARVALVLVFCLTTPVGIAVGLGVENHYAEDSKGNQAARGVLNAFATGNLLVGWVRGHVTLPKCMQL